MLRWLHDLGLKLFPSLSTVVWISWPPRRLRGGEMEDVLICNNKFVLFMDGSYLLGGHSGFAYSWLQSCRASKHSSSGAFNLVTRSFSSFWAHICIWMRSAVHFLGGGGAAVGKFPTNCPCSSWWRLWTRGWKVQTKGTGGNWGGVCCRLPRSCHTERMSLEICKTPNNRINIAITI